MFRIGDNNILEMILYLYLEILFLNLEFKMMFRLFILNNRIFWITISLCRG